MNLSDYKEQWKDLPEYHSQIHNRFVEAVNSDKDLNAHRTWTENHVWGFGERSFQWLWKLLVDEMPKEFEFLECGIFKGQILSLIGLLAQRTKKVAWRYGVTPLDESGIGWTSDYRKDIETIHNQFDIPLDYVIYKGSSTDPLIIEQAKSTAPYDIIYIDGSHEFSDVKSDLAHYPPMVKVGGYLVIDDANCEMSMEWGYFQGIADVCKAKQEWLQDNDSFEFVFSVVHVSVFKRLK